MIDSSCLTLDDSRFTSTKTRLPGDGPIFMGFLLLPVIISVSTLPIPDTMAVKVRERMVFLVEICFRAMQEALIPTQ